MKKMNIYLSYNSSISFRVVDAGFADSIDGSRMKNEVIVQRYENFLS